MRLQLSGPQLDPLNVPVAAKHWRPLVLAGPVPSYAAFAEGSGLGRNFGTGPRTPRALCRT